MSREGSGPSPLIPPARLRRVCVRLLRDWESSGVHASDLLGDAAGAFQQRDRAALQRLFYAVIRNQRLTDHVAGTLLRQSPDPLSRRLIRMGLTDLLILGSPPHAVLHETVALAGPRKSLVNAVLRRAERERDFIVDSWESLPPEIRWSVPPFLWQRWTAEFGPDHALFLARWNQEPAPVYVRLNPSPGIPLQPASVGASPVPGAPGFVLIGEVLPRAWLEEGLAYAQDPSTRIAVDLLETGPGMDILDACAAPGGKTLAMVQSGAEPGRLHAADASPERLARLEQNLHRLRLGEVRLIQRDWLLPEAGGADDGRQYHRILLDAPCSNTGVIRRRIDVPWRLQPGDFSRFADIQLRLIEALADRLLPDGRLVYSTCSLDAGENEQVVRAFLSRRPDFRLLREARCQPWSEGFDGAYAAALSRASGPA